MEKIEAVLVSGFIRSILPRLFSLFGVKYKLPKSLMSDIRFLGRELRMIAVAIDEQISGGREAHGTVLSGSVKQLRALAYQIEDCVDRLMYLAACKDEASLFRRTFRSPEMLSLKQIADEVRLLRKKLEEHSHKQGMYFDYHTLPRNPEPCFFSSGSDPDTLNADLVGIDAPMAELIEQLVENTDVLPNQLKVISIVGTHGVGKTVLARKVYGSDVGRQFSLRAWVSATGSGPREVLIGIFQDFGFPVMDSGNIFKLTMDLRRHLDMKRYFIVIDDMQTDLWNTIKAAFPGHNVVSSRVMVTTTIESVAKVCSLHNGYVYKMKRLGEEHSKQLFHKIAWPEKYYGYLRPESNEIMKKCDGLPLAIVSIGNLLRNTGWPTGHNSEEVCRNLSYHLYKDQTLERMRRVLIHTFSSLPGYIPKACLLYLGMFPSDHPINRKKLMRQWLAEGFVEEQQSSADIFDTLIDLNIIEPTDISNNGQVKTCKTYGIMHEFILHVSTSLDFTTLFPGNNDQVKTRKYVRRLSLQNHSATSGSSLDIDMSVMRSLIVFGDAGKVRLHRFKLLKVLDLEQCTNLVDAQLEDICDLFLLKYLSLGNTVTTLPKKIKKLKLLETLDLRRTKVRTLHIEVLLLPRLVHLLGRFLLSGNTKIINEHKKIVLTQGSNLETLAGLVTDGCYGLSQIIGYMKNLRKLKIWFEKNEINTNLMDLKNAIQSFINDDKDRSIDSRSLSLHFYDCNENILNSLNAPSYLSSLKLEGKLRELPEFVMSMRGLKELCLSSDKLAEDLLQALTNLSHLLYLKLVAVELGRFSIKDGAFPRLLHLCFVLQHGTLPMIEEGGLPFLISLKLICKDLIGLAGVKINHLRCLKEVTLDHRVHSETIATWQKATKEHPNKPVVLLQGSSVENNPVDSGLAGISQNQPAILTTNQQQPPPHKPSAEQDLCFFNANPETMESSSTAEASSPLQVKYADGELERLEHKLFVGMLPKNVTDAEMTDLFSKYGNIKDLQILRGSQQTSKAGCAFLKYETKEQAVAAIEALNGKHKIEGSSVPLVVKWADTEKERQARKAKKAQFQSSNMLNANAMQQNSVFGD